MRIAERVYLVGSGAIGLSHSLDCHVYLVDGGRELALIDAGAGLGVNDVLANIAADGLDVRRLTKVLLTHSHADHAGACRELQDRLGVEVICPRGEEQLLESGTERDLGLDRAIRSGIYPGDYVFRHARLDRVINDGETVTIGSLRLRAVVVPSHSPASTCYLVEVGGGTALFSSDVVFYGGTIGLGNWPGSSLAAYRDNIGKLAGLGVEMLFPGHYMWSLRDGQSHLDSAIRALAEAWVPPAWQHHHPHI